jgi:hypothetical protein
MQAKVENDLQVQEQGINGRIFEAQHEFVASMGQGKVLLELNHIDCGCCLYSKVQSCT